MNRDIDYLPEMTRNKKTLVFENTSEWVLRNAAAWCLRDSSIQFLVHSVPEGSILNLTEPLSDTLLASLDRLVNEFALRETIDQRTGQLREEIVKDSLSLVYRAKDGSAAD